MDKYHNFVKYHNKMNSISIAELSALHLNILMSIISKFCRPVYDSETKTCTPSIDVHFDECMHFTYEELRALTNLSTKKCNNRVFANLIDGMYKGLRATTCYISDGSRKIQFAVFPTFDNDKSNKTLTIEIHRLFKYLFEGLNREFTVFLLEDFLKLKGKHEKYLYMQIKRNRGLGKLTYTFDNYKADTGLDDKCTSGYVLYRVIKPAVDKLKAFIPSLSLSTVKSGKEHHLVSFTLSFDNTKKDLELTKSREIPKVITSYKTQRKSVKKSNASFEQREYSDFEYEMLEKKKLNLITPYEYTNLISFEKKLKSKTISVSERKAFRQLLMTLSVDPIKYEGFDSL